MRAILSVVALALTANPSAQAGNAVHGDAKVANFVVAGEANGEPGFEQLRFLSGPQPMKPSRVGFDF